MSQPVQVASSPPSKALPMTILLLRLLTLIFLKISIIVLVTDSVTLTIDLSSSYQGVSGFNGPNSISTAKVRFRDVYAYRYLLSAGVVGCAYTLMQIPRAVYVLGKGKRVDGNENLLRVNLLGDQVITMLLASGVGAGFGATVDLKKIADSFVDLLAVLGLLNMSQSLSKLDKFFNIVHVSTAFLLLGCLCMTLLSLLSSYALANKTAVLAA